MWTCQIWTECKSDYGRSFYIIFSNINQVCDVSVQQQIILVVCMKQPTPNVIWIDVFIPV